MRIRITKGGIFGSKGEIAVGTELDVKDEPRGWAGRYDVVGTTEGKTAVVNPQQDVDKLSVEGLKALLTDRGVIFEANAKKADLIALARG